MKRHGKIEYRANLHRSSNIKYSYISDSSTKYDTELNSGALHNINGEIGIDIVMPNSFSIFLIYERNQALGSGHTDKIHVALLHQYPLPQLLCNFLKEYVLYKIVQMEL